ncbi:MAG: Cof-type HAD-IIB family hydrolase [Dehalococcoidia bacterium]|nr:Cof-type HAD-IIB family hydrolase [Dehalococcoidia bacterium]
MKYKMVLIDIDGTLVDKNGRIAEEDKQAITRLTYESVVVALCTGRVVQDTISVINELGLNTFNVFYDGAFIANAYTKCKLFSQPVDVALVRELVDFCRQNNIYLELYANGFSSHPDNHQISANWSPTTHKDFLFSERPNWSDAIHRDFFQVVPTIVNFDDIIGREEILKAGISVNSDDEAMQAKQLRDYFGDRFRYSIAHSPAFHEVDFINLLHPQVSKGTALKELIDYWGYPASEIVAIGDGLNDIPLMEMVKVSVAMGNACDELKRVSNYVTDTIEEHGVAKAINFFFFPE